jgi:hypothetical protein
MFQAMYEYFPSPSCHWRMSYRLLIQCHHYPMWPVFLLILTYTLISFYYNSTSQPCRDSWPELVSKMMPLAKNTLPLEGVWNIKIFILFYSSKLFNSSNKVCNNKIQNLTAIAYWKSHNSTKSPIRNMRENNNNSFIHSVVCLTTDP